MTLKSKDSVKVITVRGTSFPAAEEGGSAAIEPLNASIEDSKLSEWVGQELSKSDRPDLAAAKIVVSGGKE